MTRVAVIGTHSHINVEVVEGVRKAIEAFTTPIVRLLVRCRHHVVQLVDSDDTMASLSHSA